MKKRLSKKQKEILNTLLFFCTSIILIVSLITYLWVYTEVDGTLHHVSIQKITISQLLNDIKEITNDIESLSRVDNISSRARNDLGMVPAQPESLIIYTKIPLETLYD